MVTGNDEEAAASARFLEESPPLLCQFGDIAMTMLPHAPPFGNILWLTPRVQSGKKERGEVDVSGQRETRAKEALNVAFTFEYSHYIK